MQRRFIELFASRDCSQKHKGKFSTDILGPENPLKDSTSFVRWYMNNIVKCNNKRFPKSKWNTTLVYVGNELASNHSNKEPTRVVFLIEFILQFNFRSKRIFREIMDKHAPCCFDAKVTNRKEGN